MTKYVKYIGTSHVREITQKQWAELDPPVDNVTLVWNVANGWTIPADRISDDAWPYIEADSELVVIDKDYRGMADEDRAVEADPVAFPPLVTAQTAETTPELQPPQDDDELSDEDSANVSQGDVADQHSGSRSVDEE